MHTFLSGQYDCCQDAHVDRCFVLNMNFFACMDSLWSTCPSCIKALEHFLKEQGNKWTASKVTRKKVVSTLFLLLILNVHYWYLCYLNIWLWLYTEASPYCLCIFVEFESFELDEAKRIPASLEWDFLELCLLHLSNLFDFITQCMWNFLGRLVLVPHTWITEGFNLAKLWGTEQITFCLFLGKAISIRLGSAFLGKLYVPVLWKKGNVTFWKEGSPGVKRTENNQDASLCFHAP